MSTTCYMCGDIATSYEHAPPKCIFPEQKDLPEGMDLRKNLITVPSCEVHNSNKSTDDEFLLFIVVHGYFNNKEGKDHFFSKVVRAFERRPKFIENLYKSKMPIVVDGEETVAVNIDVERFNKTISNICRALYFYETQEKWMHRIDVVSPMLYAMYQEGEDEINERTKKIYTTALQGLEHEEFRGDNKQIFCYKMSANRDRTKMICNLVLYGGFRVAAISDSTR